MRKVTRNFLFFISTYPMGILLGLGFVFLKLIRRVKVLNWKRFPHWKRKLIVVSNHPSLLETVLLPALFFYSIPG